LFGNINGSHSGNWELNYIITVITEWSMWTHFEGSGTKLLLMTFYDFVTSHFKKSKTHVFWHLKKTSNTYSWTLTEARARSRSQSVRWVVRYHAAEQNIPTGRHEERHSEFPGKYSPPKNLQRASIERQRTADKHVENNAETLHTHARTHARTHTHTRTHTHRPTAAAVLQICSPTDRQTDRLTYSAPHGIGWSSNKNTSPKWLIWVEWDVKPYSVTQSITTTTTTTTTTIHFTVNGWSKCPPDYLQSVHCTDQFSADTRKNIHQKEIK